MWAIISGIVKLFGEFFAYINNKQLLDAGKAQAQVEQIAVAEKARDELFNIQKNVSNADDAKRKQLRDKWTSKND